MLNFKKFLGKKNNSEVDEQAQQNLDLEPVSEEPKKVNKLVIGSIAAALVGVLSFAIFSGSDDATVSSKKNNNSSNVNTASMTSEQLKNLEESKAPKTQDPNKSQMDEHDHTHEDMDIHDHDHSHTDVHSSVSSTQNVSVGNAPAPSPIVLSDEEKEAKEDAKEARSEYKAKVKSRAKEDLEGSRSAIFFSLKQEKKEAPTESTKPVENANDYYNNYSKDNYISVVK